MPDKIFLCLILLIMMNVMMSEEVGTWSTELNQ